MNVPYLLQAAEFEGFAVLVDIPRLAKENVLPECVVQRERRLRHKRNRARNIHSATKPYLRHYYASSECASVSIKWQR